jgi:conjugal transfer/entry exclusion protein
MSASDQQLVAQARALAEHRRRLAGRHAVQAGVVGNIDTNRARCPRWSGQPVATGALQAPRPATSFSPCNRSSSPTSPRSSPPTAGRRAVDAERAAAAEQGREQRRRFLTPGNGYQPGNARMFHGN